MLSAKFAFTSALQHVKLRGVRAQTRVNSVDFRRLNVSANCHGWCQSHYYCYRSCNIRIHSQPWCASYRACLMPSSARNTKLCTQYLSMQRQHHFDLLERHGLKRRVPADSTSSKSRATSAINQHSSEFWALKFKLCGACQPAVFFAHCQTRALCQRIVTLTAAACTTQADRTIRSVLHGGQTRAAILLFDLT